MAGKYIEPWLGLTPVLERWAVIPIIYIPSLQIPNRRNLPIQDHIRKSLPMPEKQGWAVVLVISRLIIILVSFPFATLSRIVRQRKGTRRGRKGDAVWKFTFSKFAQFPWQMTFENERKSFGQDRQRDHRRRPSCLWWWLWRGFTIIINSINPRNSTRCKKYKYLQWQGLVSNSFPLNKSQIEDLWFT